MSPTASIAPRHHRGTTRTLARARAPRFTHLRRYREIAAVLVKYGFVDVVHALHLTPYLAAGRRLLSVVGKAGEPELSRAVRLRLAMEALGPTFIKFGQAVSTHRDMVPADIIAELTQLQDGVPAMPPGTARRAIEQALGQPLDRLFAEFCPEPVG